MQHKQLPPNPSLEHLKSQAKLLLKAHKESTLDAFQRIRAFFPKLSDATDAEIQSAAFGLQDAQLVIAREYGFVSWPRLKAQVMHPEQDTGQMSSKDVLFQILRTDTVEQADVQTVEALLIAEPSLISARDENGRTPVQVLAARKIVHDVKNSPLQHLYSLLLARGAAPDIVAAIVMDDVEGGEAQIGSNPQVLKQRFDIPGFWRGISVLAIAARYARTEIARVLIEADASLVTAGQAQGKTPMDLLVKPWHPSAFELEPRLPIYNLLIENGAIPDLGAAIVMNDLARVQQYVTANPQLIAQQFVCGNRIVLCPVEIAAAHGHPDILVFLATVATERQIDIAQDLAQALSQTFDLGVTEWLLKTTQPAASALTDALAFACEVYQPEKVRLLLKYGAAPSASVRAKFRYDVVQNLKQSDDASRNYEMSPLLVAIGTWYGVREEAPALDECLEIVEALLEAGADLHRRYNVDIDGEILELTPLAYTRKLASLFPDKPFEKVFRHLAKRETTLKMVSIYS